MKRYGYVRVSTLQQNKERQIRNIQEQYPDAVIISDEFTGTEMDRPAWSKLYPKLRRGDTVVFDSVSRMSRDAEEGFRVYQELYERDVDLVFLKEPHINTEAYREALKGSIKLDVSSGDQDTDDLISGIMTAVNRFMLAKVKSDIKKAFEQSQKEVDDLRQRVREGMAETRKNNESLKVLYPDSYKDRADYKKVGRETGDKLHVKKAEPIKELIREYSRDFNGHNTDAEVLAILSTKTVKIPIMKRSGKTEEKEISAQISRNTLYKYKREMRAWDLAPAYEWSKVKDDGNTAEVDVEVMDITKPDTVIQVEVNEVKK